MTANSNILALTFLQSRPEKAAEILEQMDLQIVTNFLREVPHTIVGPVMAFMLPQYAARIVSLLDKDTAASFLSAMNGRKAASVLRYTEKKMRKALMAKLPTKAGNLLGLFLGFAEDMVGAWMIPDIMLLPDDCTSREAMQRFKNTDQHTHGGIVYVVNRDAQIQGSLHVSALLRQSTDVPVSAIMQEENATVSARATLSSVQDHKGWETKNTLPVVNKEKQLIGVLRHTDLHQGLQQVLGHIKQPSGSDAVTGLWEVYGTALLALFDVAGGFGTFDKAKNKQEKLL